MDSIDGTGLPAQPQPQTPRKWSEIEQESSIYALPPEQRIGLFDQWAKEAQDYQLKAGGFDKPENFQKFKLKEIQTRKRLMSPMGDDPDPADVENEYNKYINLISGEQQRLSTVKPDQKAYQEVLDGKRNAAFIGGQMIFNPKVTRDPALYRQALAETDAPTDIKLIYAGRREDEDKRASLTRRDELASKVVTPKVAERIVSAVQEGTEVLGFDLRSPQDVGIQKGPNGIWSVADPEYVDWDKGIIGGVMTKVLPASRAQYKPMKELNEFQQKYGLSDDEMKQDYMEALKRSAPTSLSRWVTNADSLEDYVPVLNSTVRVLDPDIKPRVIVPNGDLAFDKEAYDAAVDKAKAPEEAKTLAKESRTQVAKALAVPTYNLLLNNRSDFMPYAEKVKTQEDMVGAVEKYYKDKKDQAWYEDLNEFLGQNIGGAMAGARRIWNLRNVIPAMFGDIESAENAAAIEQDIAAQQQTAQMVGGRMAMPTAFKVSRDVAAILPDVAMQLAVNAITGGMASSATVASLASRTGIGYAAARTALGAAMSGTEKAGISQVISRIPGIAVNAVDDIADAAMASAKNLTSKNPLKGGLGTQQALSGAMAGMSSMSGTFTDVYSALRKEGMAPEQALDKARNAAAVAAAITAGITYGFSASGRGGVEDAGTTSRGVAGNFTVRDLWDAGMVDLLQDEYGRQAIKKTALGILRKSSDEALEETLDQFAGGLAQYVTNPSQEAQDKSVSEVIQESLYAGLLGGIVGGGVTSLQQAVRTRGDMTAAQVGTEMAGVTAPPPPAPAPAAPAAPAQITSAPAPAAATPAVPTPVAKVAPAAPVVPAAAPPTPAPVTPATAPQPSPAAVNAINVAQNVAQNPDASITAAALVQVANQAPPVPPAVEEEAPPVQETPEPTPPAVEPPPVEEPAVEVANEQMTPEEARAISNTAKLEDKYRLEKPIKGSTDAEIVGYQWVSTVEDGMYGDRRVSDWSGAQTSVPTGRQIVHLFWVRTPDGQETLMGVGAAKNALGLNEQRLYRIAKQEQEAQAYIAKLQAEELKSIDSIAVDTPTEAARLHRKTTYSPMRSTEENERLFRDSVLLTKNEKFLRAGPARQALMEANGWAVVSDDPMKRAIGAIAAPEALAAEVTPTAVPEKTLDAISQYPDFLELITKDVTLDPPQLSRYLAFRESTTSVPKADIARVKKEAKNPNASDVELLLSRYAEERKQKADQGKEIASALKRTGESDELDSAINNYNLAKSALDSARIKRNNPLTGAQFETRRLSSQVGDAQRRVKDAGEKLVSVAARTKQPAPKAEEAPAEATPATEPFAAPEAAATEAPVEPKGLQGSKFESSMPKGKERVTGQYAIMEAGDLVTSFDQGFPKELQPRDRTRAASKEQISEIAINLDPERLGESPTVDVGAPNIDENGAVLSGNGRVTAIRANYQSGGSDYKNWLAQNAERFGFSSADVAGMTNPVLVRRITDYGKLSKEEFAVQANQSQVLTMSKGEKAKADASILLSNADLFAKFRPSEDGNVLVSTNREFISEFVKETNATDLLAADGSWTPDLGIRIQNAVLATMLGGDDIIIQNLIEDPSGYGLKKISAALALNAPNLVKLFGTDYSINQPITQAIKDFISVKNSGQKVEEFLDQSMLFADPERTAVSDMLLTKIYNAKSQKELNEFFSTYASSAENSLEDQRSGGLFGDQPRTVQQIITDLTSNAAKPAEAKQEDLAFGKPQATPAKPAAGKRQKAQSAAATPEVATTKPALSENDTPDPNAKDDLSVSSVSRQKYTPGEARKAGITRIAADLGITSGGMDSIRPVLERLSNSKNRRHRKVATDLLPILEGSDVKIQLVSVDPLKNGWYDPDTNTVFINLDGPHEMGLQETILHELVHAGTEEAIRNPVTDAQKRLVQSLEQQMQDARKAAESLIRQKLGKDVDMTNWASLVRQARNLNDFDFFDVVYGLSNLSEFSTHATTSKAFQQFLANVQRGGKKLGLFDRFVAAISKFFTGKTDFATDVYRDIISLIGTADKGSVRRPNYDPAALAEFTGVMESTARGVTAEEDAEYLAAVEAGDMETAQRMVDEAAKKAGYNVGPVFHGTDVKFPNENIFDPSKAQIGIHLGTEKQARDVSRSKIYKAYIKLLNPLRLTDYTDDWSSSYLQSEMEEIITKEDYLFLKNSRDTEEFDIYINPDASAPVREEFSNDEEFEKAWEKFTKPITDKRKADHYYIYRKSLLNAGYDGVVYLNRQEGIPLSAGTRSNMGDARFLNRFPDAEDSFIVLAPSQIKSADPVTYDDSGNVIPLSQRFQPESPDIRYSTARGRFTIPDAITAIRNGDTETPFTALNEAIEQSMERERMRQAESERRRAPRATGKGSILEQIARARTSGRLPVEVASALNQFVEGLRDDALADTRVSLSARAENNTYDFAENLITLAIRSAESPEQMTHTAIHEFYHGLSRFIPDEELAKMKEDYIKAVKSYVKDNPWFVPFIGRRFITPQQYDDISRMLTPEELKNLPVGPEIDDGNGNKLRKINFSRENYRLMRFDEWVVENLADAMTRKMERPVTMMERIARIIRDFVDLMRERLLRNPYLRVVEMMSSPVNTALTALRDGPIEETAPVMYGGPAVGDGNQFVLGMYAGEQSLQSMQEEQRKFMQDSLDAAKAMAAAGKSMEEIRAVTGWFPGPYDGKMRWEIPDQDAKVNKAKVTELGESDFPRMMKAVLGGVLTDDDFVKVANLEDVLDHKPLFEAYPAARKIGFGFQPEQGGTFFPEKNLITVDYNSAIKEEGSIFHEIQHWIQQTEGFSKWSRPDMFTRTYPPRTQQAAIDWLVSQGVSPEEDYGYSDKNDYVKLAKSKGWDGPAFLMKPMTAYLYSAGEYEARDIEARRMLTDEQRKATAPFSSENIAVEDAIVMGVRESPARSAVTTTLSLYAPSLRMSSEPTSTDAVYYDGVRLAVNDSLLEGMDEDDARVAAQRATVAFNVASDDPVVSDIIQKPGFLVPTVLPDEMRLSVARGLMDATKYASENGIYPLAFDLATQADEYGATGIMLGQMPASEARGVTAEEDALHADLERRFKAGDEAAQEDAQRMVDEAARNASGMPVWHKSRGKTYAAKTGKYEQSTEDWTTFEPEKATYGVFYASTDKAAVEGWMNSGKTKRFFVFPRKTAKAGQDIVGSSFLGDADRKMLESQGFDSVSGFGQGWGSGAPEIAIFNPNQIKSADPFTYDDNGNLIPLSQRFQPESPDIRFSTARGVVRIPGEEVIAFSPMQKMLSKFKGRGLMTPEAFEATLASENLKQEGQNAARFLAFNMNKAIEKTFGDDTQSVRVFVISDSGKPSFTNPFKSVKDAQDFATKNGYINYVIKSPEEIINISLGNAESSLTAEQEKMLEESEEAGIEKIKDSVSKAIGRMLKSLEDQATAARKAGAPKSRFDELDNERKIFRETIAQEQARMEEKLKARQIAMQNDMRQQNRERFIENQEAMRAYLPDSILEEIVAARDAIDGNSETIKGFDYLMRGGMMRLIFDSQMGTYVTRSYEAFEAPSREDHVAWLNQAYQAVMINPKDARGKLKRYDRLAAERIMPLIRVLTGRIIDNRARDIIKEADMEMVNEIQLELAQQKFYKFLDQAELLRRRRRNKALFVKSLANYLAGDLATLYDADKEGRTSELSDKPDPKDVRRVARRVARDIYNNPDEFTDLLDDSGIEYDKLLKYRLPTRYEAEIVARQQYNAAEYARRKGVADMSGVKWRDSTESKSHDTFIAALNSDFQRNLEFIAKAPGSRSASASDTADWAKLNAQILKHRDNIPDYMRKFWGEIENPARRVTQTIVKQASLIANAQWREQIARIGKEQGWAVDREEFIANQDKYSGWKKLISGDEGYEGNPLKDIYIQPDMYNSLDIRRAPNEPSNSAFKFIGGWVGLALWNATSGLFRGATRNFASFPNWALNAGMMIANPMEFGRLMSNLGIAGKAVSQHLATVPKIEGGRKEDAAPLRAVKNTWGWLLQSYGFTGIGSRIIGKISGGINVASEFFGRLEDKSNDKGYQELYVRAVKNGIADNNVEKNDMARLLGYEDEVTRRPIGSKRYEKLLGALYIPDKMIDSLGYLWKSGKSVMGNRTEYYSSMDSMSKIAIWLSEMEAQAEIHAKDKAQFDEWRGKDGMFRNLPEELQQKAAIKVTNTVQSDSRIAEGVAQFRNAGWGKLMSPFLAFRVESIRNAANAYRIAYDEITNGINAKEKARGAKRLASALMAHSMYAYIAQFVAISVMNAVGGGDDDEEGGVTLVGAELDGLRKMLPEWAQNKVLAARVYKNGDIDWADVSFQLPFGWMNEVFISAQRGLDKTNPDDIIAGEVALQIVGDFVGNFTQRQIAIEAINNAMSGYDRVRNKEIWEKDDNIIVKINKGVEYYFKNAGYPGDVRDAIKMYKAAYGIEENGSKYKMDAVALSMFTGQSIRTQKVDEMFLSKMRQAQDHYRVVNRSLYGSALRDANNVDPDDVYQDTLLARSRFNDITRDLNKTYAAAVDILKMGGMSQSEAKKKINAVMTSQEVKLSQTLERAIRNGTIPPYRASKITEDKMKALERKYNDNRFSGYLQALTLKSKRQD